MIGFFASLRVLDTSVSSDRSEIFRGDWMPLELLFAGA
jgi:hypothetical protein